MLGELADRPPVLAWRHWPGDDQRAADFAHALLVFHAAYDWDAAVVPPHTSYLTEDYGVTSAWQGDATGDRTVTRHAVTRSLEWTELRVLDPQRGVLGRQLECLRLVRDGLDADTPLVITVPSPLTQASAVAGDTLMTRNMRTHPDRLQTGLNILTDSTLRFVEALRRIPVDGVWLLTTHATYDRLSAVEYATFGAPYDLKILEIAAELFWLNGVQIDADAPQFEHVQNYPVGVVNWRTCGKRPALLQGKSMLRGAASGGLDSWDHLYYGTPAAVREAARSALTDANSRRLVLAPERALPVGVPLSNLRALRDVVKPVGVR